MWVLVISTTGATTGGQEPPGGAELLRELGCSVEVDTFFADVSPTHSRPPPNIILLEVGDHPEVAAPELRRLRRIPSLSDAPSLVAVSASRVTSVEWSAGFDDFILMPYVPQELYARVRQLEWRKSAFSHEEVLKADDLIVDLAAHEVRVAGREVPLTHQELALLAFLLRHRGRVFSRTELLRKVWGVDHYGRSRTVDIHVRRLRLKLGRSASSLETVRGAGYKYRQAR
ncbi:MAG: response regulator transcription factor [Deltaproteobacteria bacterium]|nr:response regulator transcription factor [Deltaproteobacteria bacterium]